MIDLSLQYALAAGQIGQAPDEFEQSPRRQGSRQNQSAFVLHGVGDPPLGVAETRGDRRQLRSSITVREAGDEVDDTPGFFEGDTVAHCDPTLRGEFCPTVNLTGMRTGWDLDPHCGAYPGTARPRTSVEPDPG